MVQNMRGFTQTVTTYNASCLLGECSIRVCNLCKLTVVVHPTLLGHMINLDIYVWVCI